MDEKGGVRQKCVFTVHKANCILGHMKQNMASRSREVLFLLCSVLMRSQLEYFIQLWDTKYKKDTELLNQVQGRAMKMFKATEYVPCEERLRELKLFSL